MKQCLESHRLENREIIFFIRRKFSVCFIPSIQPGQLALSKGEDKRKNDFGYKDLWLILESSLIWYPFRNISNSKIYLRAWRSCGIKMQNALEIKSTIHLKQREVLVWQSLDLPVISRLWASMVKSVFQDLCVKMERRLVVGNLIFLCYCFWNIRTSACLLGLCPEGLILLKDPVKTLEFV